ncbi:hypothetical protein [Paraflavitalea speifideaquila]|uniref:hypothetical protein n=1 Tax=Paraflavitalea speifideaquila TaxID=3076558 RepID=UPI0028E44EE2|nr:hypothetical protein [Paraflavitalea speifideiaquila]
MLLPHIFNRHGTDGPWLVRSTADFPSSRLPVFPSSRLPVFPSSRLPDFPTSRQAAPTTPGSISFKKLNQAVKEIYQHRDKYIGILQKAVQGIEGYMIANTATGGGYYWRSSGIIWQEA